MHSGIYACSLLCCSRWPSTLRASILGCFCLDCLFLQQVDWWLLPWAESRFFFTSAMLGNPQGSVLQLQKDWLSSMARAPSSPPTHHFPCVTFLLPLHVVLSPSTFLKLHPSWVFPAPYHSLLQLFNPQMEVSLSSICPILLPRHNHGYIIGKVYRIITNALQRTDCKPKAERERILENCLFFLVVQSLLYPPSPHITAGTLIVAERLQHRAHCWSRPPPSQYLISRHSRWVARLLLSTKHMSAVRNSVLEGHLAAKHGPTDQICRALKTQIRRRHD